MLRASAPRLRPPGGARRGARGSCESAGLSPASLGRGSANSLVPSRDASSRSCGRRGWPPKGTVFPGSAPLTPAGLSPRGTEWPAPSSSLPPSVAFSARASDSAGHWGRRRSKFLLGPRCAVKMAGPGRSEPGQPLQPPFGVPGLMLAPKAARLLPGLGARLHGGHGPQSPASVRRSAAGMTGPASGGSRAPAGTGARCRWSPSRWTHGGKSRPEGGADTWAARPRPATAATAAATSSAGAVSLANFPLRPRYAPAGSWIFIRRGLGLRPRPARQSRARGGVCALPRPRLPGADPAVPTAVRAVCGWSLDNLGVDRRDGFCHDRPRCALWGWGPGSFTPSLLLGTGGFFMQCALSEASFELVKPLLPTLPECWQPAGEGTPRPSASRRVRGGFAGERGSGALLGIVRKMVLEAWRCGRSGMTAVHSRWWGWTGGSRGGGTREPKGAGTRGVGTRAGGKKGVSSCLSWGTWGSVSFLTWRVGFRSQRGFC